MKTSAIEMAITNDLFLVEQMRLSTDNKTIYIAS